MTRLAFVLFVVLSLLPLAAFSDSPLASFRLGIFPYTAPRQIIDFFGPVAASMEAAIQHPVKLESAASFPDFSRDLDEQKYDIALIQPFDYPKVVEKYGYIPIARQNSPLITQFMVREGSPLRTLSDLRNGTVALPPETSANARMAIRTLADHKLKAGKDISIRAFNSHDSCMQQVLIGEADACATSMVPLQVFEQRMQVKFRSIYDTPPIPHVLFVVHPRVPEAIRKKLQQLILNWGNTESGRAILDKISPPGYAIPDPKEYAIMRHYNPVGSVKSSSTIPVKELVLGIFPFVNTRQIAQNFSPTLAPLSAATGVPVQLRTSSSFDTFDASLKSAIFDIVLVQPFDWGKATSYGYLPLANMKEPIQGTFLVKKQSPYQSITDFKNKTIAMPPEFSVQSRLGRHALKQAGLTPGLDVTVHYRKTHDSCLQQVNLGEAEACVSSERTPKMLPSEFGQNLRKVGDTIKIPGVLFMAHQRLPEKTRTAAIKEISSWPDSESGRQILKSIGLGEFAPADSSDYQHLPKLD